MSAIEDFDDITGPIAPSTAAWEAMTAAERQRVVATLPHVVQHDFMSEGDIHAGIVLDLADALRNHYGGGGPGDRRCYIGRSVMVHYPETRAFAPDLFLVFDVDDHPRKRFVVSEEGRGLDLALEVLCDGDAGKDYRRNVSLYSKVGITEYFIVDSNRNKITGYRLEDGEATYRPILGQHGRLYSKVLDLWIGRLEGKFRVFSRDAVLPTTAELKERFRREVELAVLSAGAAEDRAEAEAQRAEAEAQRAARLEEEVQRLRKQLEALGADSESRHGD